MKRITKIVVAGAGAAAVLVAGAGVADAYSQKHRFEMVRTEGVDCLPEATATVTIRELGPVELMTVKAKGLPADTEFDLFVTQIPNAPFGLSWYQGDMETDSRGRATGRFLGRFNEETFSVAPAEVPAPVVHDDGQFADADVNPRTAPVHQFHLGLWFNSPEDAAAAGCPDITTPFNGEHDAGVQILNTGTFPDEAGPLSEIG